MSRRLALLALLAGIAVVAVAGYAIGAGGAAKNVTLCAAKGDGAVSLAAGKGKCGKGEKKIVVSKQGPPGLVGPQGAPGPDGSTANLALEPVHLVTGPPTAQCPVKFGAFCTGSFISGGWRNIDGFAPAGFYKDPAGIVHLVGAAYFASSGGESGGFAPEGPFYLPLGYRPAGLEIFEVPAGSELAGIKSLEVRPDGTVAVASGVVGLSGITFKAGS